MSDTDQEVAAEPDETVTVASIPTATHSLLPRAIADFRGAGHRGRIRISDLSANEVLDAISNGEVDFGINFIGSQDPTFEFRPLTEDRFALAMRRDDPLSEKTSIRWTEIDPTRFIAVWKGSGNRMLIDNALARSRITLDWAYEARHLSTALALVEAGVGVTALPASAIPDTAQSMVVSRPLVDPDIVRTIGAVRRANATLSPTAEKLYSTLLSLSPTDS
jgi:DNA-binding transcriptional LysR family regulator